ncbi:MAG TPA: hypothetical protein VFV49_11565 [Thermoanaerobaculia bacterium]|nr:hypothetical protein [Thermoanaerobaculia bacterium]
MKTPARRRRVRDSERGAALILVIFASTLILLLLLTIHTMTATAGRGIVRQLQSQGQATNAAGSGLNEALSWFVHQNQQPVTVFDPKADTGGICTHSPKHSPLIYESEDPAIGIVRSYEIAGQGRVWGRYEVRRTAVADVSKKRGKPADGALWKLESSGIVYVRNDSTKGPGIGPNFVLARRTMSVDIQRMAIQLPANAALSATEGSKILVSKPSKLQGGSSGIGAAYPPSTGTPKGNGTISGNPASSTTTLPFTIEGVFGVTQTELLSMADLVVDDEQDLPEPLPDMALIVIRGNATFNPQRKLTGSGILVVLGNLTLNPQSDTYYSGLIWVQGNFTMTPPGIINGAVISSGNAHLTGGSDVAEVNYDQAMLNQIRLQLGNYLFSRSPFVVEKQGG